MLLLTKLYAPAPRAALVARPRLLSLLDEALTGKLTLVSAPAGFGKTTLVSTWLQSSAHPFAWLSLDEGDNEPMRFFTHLVGALQQVVPGVGDAVPEMFHAPQPPPLEGVVVALLNALTAHTEPLLLVLDDYHVLTHPPLQAAVAFLIEQLPPTLHLLLTTRHDPPLPLPRLRVRRQLAEIRAADLRFTEEEAAEFLNQLMGLNLTAESVAALERRTEGWIAGLQLAALSLRGRADATTFIAAFAGDDRHVVDYLMEEVVACQPPDVQAFLLHTSLLNRLNAPLCAALLAEPIRSSQAMLERLDAANLFLIPLDTQRGWYRYHHLFADLLRYRLQREAPEQVPTLHRRASLWFAQAGELEEALHHALAIPDTTLAADLLAEESEQLIAESYITTLLKWMARLPPAELYARPYLSVGCAWALTLTWQAEAAQTFLGAVEAALPTFTGHYLPKFGRTITREELQGHLTAIRSFLARLYGEIAESNRLAHLALEQLPQEAAIARIAAGLSLGTTHLELGTWEEAQVALEEAATLAQRTTLNPYAGLEALNLQGLVSALRGRLSEAEAFYHEALRLGTRGQPLPATYTTHTALAEVHLLRHDLPEATAFLERGEPLAAQMGRYEGLVEIRLLQAQVALAAGNLSLAHALVEKAETTIREREVAIAQLFQWLPTHVLLNLAQGKPTAARALLDVHTPAPAGSGANVRFTLCYLWARLALAVGATDEAQRWAERAEALTAKLPVLGAAVISLTLHAAAYHARRDTPQALDYLGQALTLAAPEQIARPFLDLGEPMHELLRLALAQGLEPAFTTRLLATHAAPPPPVSPAPVHEPLTERELQVLHLLDVGLSSTEVAAELLVAPSTVRSYIKSLHSKLDAHSRPDLLARAHALGLV